MPKLKSGQKPVVRDSAFYAGIGRKGGLKTKATQLAKNPNYYSEIGDKGGQSMKNSHGRDFYSMIGKMSKRPVNTDQAES